VIIAYRKKNGKVDNFYTTIVRLGYNSAMTKSQLIQKIAHSNGTEFQKMIWRELLNIPRGQVVTYTELAERVGRPLSVRAAANAVGANPFAPDVPCHRVVRSDGGLGGYSAEGGTDRKRQLLVNEGVKLE
jgi:methylated-DNA-[protein]-cysteine S-methyltransferase